MEMPAINLPQIDKKYKILAVLGITALLLGYYYDHAYKPHAEKIEELKSDIQTIDDTLQVIKTLEYPNLTSNKAILTKVESKNKYIMAEIEKHEKELASKNQFSKILEQITVMSYESGFDIKALEPKEFTLKQDYNSMLLNIEVNSRFKNLLDFLEKLKTLPIFPESIFIDIRERPDLSIRLTVSILAR
jgi:Tfp pilus assembly protein PilO